MDELAQARRELPLHPHVFEILLALLEGPAHGYAIIKQIDAQSGGTVRLSTSSLYASLKRMEAKGLVEDAGARPQPSGGPPRKYFHVTPLGRRAARLEALRLRHATALAERRLGAEAVPTERRD